uniref:FecR domain-containing protein n=1 Tax=Roseihalotalea indica TaxID=2867963 RepID=A0AA49GQN3_9BACT|nr:FecR domain-containing protein [Tunicatimonas sp. TK19036]
MADQEITTERLAADEHFQQWVLNPTPALEQYWQAWIQKRPEHRETVQQAKLLLLNLQIEEEPQAEELQQQIWKQVKAVMDEESVGKVAYLYSRNFKIWVAASVLILLTGSAIFFTYHLRNTANYHTAYGETETIYLPDGSTVILNANSSLRFAAGWEEKNVREVWLEGEAFFEVKKISMSTDSSSSMRLPFIVHSQNMDVEVLGTTFNVKDRDKYSEVVLNTGKVSVLPKQEQIVAPIPMEPGDMLAYSAQEQQWKMQQVNPELHTSWRNQELIFDEMPLADIALLLEETYGYSITFREEEVRNYVFTGNIKSDEIELLIPMLARSFGLEVQQNGRDITFSEK